ncbi:glycosyltransferase [Acidipropionibacterium jensenii]|uniref:glycosyltransferase n=1 Tax=Acidipropionibacterium jensenii TaxID=1749 RepID=UPI001585F76A|nr:glycosyltransferase [Acidipropionibacterium jensenii]
MTDDRLRRRLAGAGYRGLLGLTALTDALPARLRFGHWQSVLALTRPADDLPAVPRPPGPPSDGRDAPSPDPVPHQSWGPSCMLVAGELDGGGVEQVVATLALGLPGEGFEVEVVTSRSGRVGAELVAAGVTVTVCDTEGLADLIAGRHPDVIELHRPDPGLVSAVAASQRPVIPVFHAVESYLDSGARATLAALSGSAPACIAVSSGVARYFSGLAEGARISVVVNGVAPDGVAHAPDRVGARTVLGETIGSPILDEDILVVALQRYSDQKNPAGLVDAFLVAAEKDPRMRLVVAGSPDNWLEYRRADLLRRRSALGERVHLLGDSDPATILAAGDVYALDSFAEGGPLSAVEAALHGLPLVLSDVGFARDLVGREGVVGEVVDGPCPGFGQADLARVRRRLHQPNRRLFADALVRAPGRGRGRSGQVQEPFTERAMVAGHAGVLRSVLD